MDMMASLGIDKSRMTAEGYGEAIRWLTTPRRRVARATGE
jgi:hypothetical protein